MFELLKKYRVLLLFVCGTMLYFCANLQRVAIPGAVFNELQMMWGLTASQVTNFGASFMYVYAVSQLFVGLLNDRFGGARVMTAGGVVFVFGELVFSLMDNYYLLCIGRGLTGLGASAFYLGLVAEAIRYYKKNYSLIISVIVMTGYAGGIVANAPFSFAVEQTSLRTVLIGSAVLTLIFFLLYLVPCRSIRKPAIRNVPFSFRNFWQIMKSKNNWNIFLFTGINWGLYYSIQTVIGKKFLEDFCRIPAGTAAMYLSGTSVISAAAGFFYALGSKKLGNRCKPFCLLTGCMSCLVFLLLAAFTALDMHNVFPAILICCLASTSSLSAIVIPLLKESNVPGETGSAISFSNFLAYIFVAIFGNMIGGVLNLFAPECVAGKLIYSRIAYLTVFIIMFVCAAAVLYCAVQIREPRKKTKRVFGEPE